jgi:voltage-gated potassium channel
MSVILQNGKESPEGKSLSNKIIGKYYRNGRKHTEREVITASVTAISVLLIIIQYAFTLSGAQTKIVYVTDFLIVAFLWFDFYFRMKSSDEGSLQFIIKHLYELPALVPLFTFSILESQTILGAGMRGLRLIRLFRLLHLSFRLVKIFEGSGFLYLVVFSIMIIISGAFGAYMVEHSEKGATIRTLGDAFWWTISTVTLATYGDVYPVTAVGKMIATLLMFAGLTIFGFFISSVGTKMMESRFTKSRIGLMDETRSLIKYRIDIMEKLTLEDFDDLILSMKNLRNTLLEKENKAKSPFTSKD